MEWRSRGGEKMKRREVDGVDGREISQNEYRSS